MPKRSYLGDFELMVLLAVLRLGQDAYGVPRLFWKRSKCNPGHARSHLGTFVYAALERLEAKGLATSEVGEPTPERGGRAKRYFHVTKKGLREIRDARQALMNLWQGLSELEGGRT